MALAAELRASIDQLTKRREFGLNFEKHRPETVELHGRQVRAGDKVRFLAPRGATEAVRRDVWVVETVQGAKGWRHESRRPHRPQHRGSI